MLQSPVCANIILRGGGPIRSDSEFEGSEGLEVFELRDHNLGSEARLSATIHEAS